MGKKSNNTLLYVGLGAAAVYLLSNRQAAPAPTTPPNYATGQQPLDWNAAGQAVANVFNSIFPKKKEQPKVDFRTQQTDNQRRQGRGIDADKAASDYYGNVVSTRMGRIGCVGQPWPSKSGCIGRIGCAGNNCQCMNTCSYNHFQRNYVISGPGCPNILANNYMIS